MTFDSGTWAPRPEDFFDDQEGRCRQVLAEADFPIFGVDRSGRGVRGAAPARETGHAPTGGGAVAGDAAIGDAVDSDALSAFETHNGELSWVELRSGDWSSLDGPYVTVRTYRPGAERSHPLPELEEVVEDERDRVYEQLGVDEGEFPGRVRALREWITVEGEPTAVQIHEESQPAADPRAGLRSVWAGRLRVYGITVTVCGRGVAPGGVELTRVQGFDHYLLGRTELLRALAVRRERRTAAARSADLNAVGLDAHRAVVEYSVAHALAEQAQLLTCRPSRLPRRLRGEDRAQRWEAAVRQQMRLACETRQEADESVATMVNHLTRLAEHADWAQGTLDGQAALEEVVRYTAFASEVPSLPAQRAWARFWAGSAECASGGAGRSAELERLHLAEQAWLTAWEQWRRERGR